MCAFPETPWKSCASEMYPKVTGTPCSCIAATYDSETAADIPSKPGKPGWPNGSAIGWPSRSVSGTLAGWPVRTGSIDWAPNRPLKPV